MTMLLALVIATAEPCVVEADGPLLPECAIVDGKTVTPAARRTLSFDKFGLAGMYASSTGWMYIDRRGRIVADHVYAFDNGPDPFEDGLARVVRDGKVGFVDRKGRLVIPAMYDGAFQFEKGRARVCIGCTNVCADQVAPERCEHHTYEGGTFKTIDRKNRES